MFVDYDYDFYGYMDYRGGYSDPYFDECYQSYDGEFYYDFPLLNGVAPPAPMNATTVGGGAGCPQKPTRNSPVGLIYIFLLFCVLIFNQTNNNNFKKKSIFCFVFI